MSGDLEPPGFGGDQGVFVGLGGGQGAGRIQIHQIIIIIEHTFNIRRITDTSATKRHPATDGQYLADPDNTCRNFGPAGLPRYLSLGCRCSGLSSQRAGSGMTATLADARRRAAHRLGSAARRG
jgi:hypothetical protein